VSVYAAESSEFLLLVMWPRRVSVFFFKHVAHSVPPSRLSTKFRFPSSSPKNLTNPRRKSCGRSQRAVIREKLVGVVRSFGRHQYDAWKAAQARREGRACGIVSDISRIKLLPFSVVLFVCHHCELESFS